MIHSGSVIAAGISQGRSTSLKRDFKVSPIHTVDWGFVAAFQLSLHPDLWGSFNIQFLTISNSKGSLACSQSRWL